MAGVLQWKDKGFSGRTDWKLKPIALCELQQGMELCLGMDDEPAERWWVRSSGQKNMADVAKGHWSWKSSSSFSYWKKLKNFQTTGRSLTFTEFGVQQGLESLVSSEGATQQVPNNPLPGSEVCGQQQPGQRSVSGGVMWGWYWHKSCFTDRDDLTVTLQRFPRDTKLEEVIATWKGHGAIQKDINSMEKWIGRNLMKLKTRK